MVTLAIEGSGGSELTYQLAKASISIGASSHNDIVLRSPGVAPRHLVIQRNDSVYTFLAQPRQMVVLNGERRSRGVLRVGDRIRIGTATVIFKGVGEDETDITLVSEDSREVRQSAPADTGGARAADRSRPLRGGAVQRTAPGRRGPATHGGGVSDRRPVRSRAFPAHLLGALLRRPASDARLAGRGRALPAHRVPWTGEVPRLPARTFDELGGGGRTRCCALPSASC